MSSSSARPMPGISRRIFAGAAVAGLSLGLAGCIQPLYGPTIGGGSMAADLQADVKTLIADAALRGKIQREKYVTENVGLPTLTDIVAELAKPGRDPRQVFEAFSFAEGVGKIEDLTPGMMLPGVVTNVTAFGAFVDVGVHQDGLVHISAMSSTYIKNPADFLKVGQKVKVWVLEVDIARKRVSLTMVKGFAPKERSKTDGKPNTGISKSGGYNRPLQQPQAPARKELYRW